MVVNNAGYGDVAAVEDVTLADFFAQIDTNFYGVVHVSKAALPILREQGFGHIFQVSSLGGRIGSVGLAAYQSAKWAVGGFSTVLAQEVAPPRHQGHRAGAGRYAHRLGRLVHDHHAHQRALPAHGRRLRRTAADRLRR
ncbi:SDR family NAD(P)-dependent oxidoreductase [Streptomyces sp. NPDC050564]|uniref:SDR family NAD(P)-dependent oxidoreductase n=1 Tax=Streptomyces sp. NPDC050564 TaxID=3365631 RepID=UPI0037BB7351